MTPKDLKEELSAILNKYQGYDPTRSRFYNVGKFIAGHGETGYNRKNSLQAIISNADSDSMLLHQTAEYYIDCFTQNNRKSRGSDLLREIAVFLKKNFLISNAEIMAKSPSYTHGFSYGEVLAEKVYDLQAGFLVVLKEKLRLTKSESAQPDHQQTF